MIRFLFSPMTKFLPERRSVPVAQEETADTRNAALWTRSPFIDASCRQELAEGLAAVHHPSLVVRSVDVRLAHTSSQHTGEAVVVVLSATSAPIQPRKCDAVVGEGKGHGGICFIDIILFVDCAL